MDRLKIIMVLLVILACSIQFGCVNGREKTAGVEKLDNGNQIIKITGAKSGLQYERYEIEYIVEGVKYRNYFDPNLKESFEWINENLGKDDVVLSWWDWGPMIQGATDSKAVVTAPSKEILEYVASKKWDEEFQGPLSTAERIRNVARMLTTLNPDVMKQGMQKYNSKYVFVTNADKDASQAMMLSIGESTEDYFDEIGDPTQANSRRMIHRMLAGQEIKGFSFEYSDYFVNIYKIIE